jgi:purine-cytosine permease-like protein
MLNPEKLNQDEDIGEALSYDLAYDVVPDSARRSAFSMGLLWLATQTTFSSMFVGFAVQQSGQPLAGMLWGCAIGVLCLNAYGFLAGYLGAVTGQMQPFLTRAVFGKTGSIIVSIFLIIMGSGWYSFQSVYTGQMLQGLFPHVGISITVIALFFALIMATNNIIGFKGIGRFGRFAAPFIFFVAVYALWQTFSSTPASVLWGTPKIHNTTTIIATASLIVGTGVYGAEPDIWRFSRRSFTSVALPMGLANTLGLFLFPAAGWVMALTSEGATPAQQSMVIVHYLFDSVPIAAILILLSQFALNDVNMYEATNAMTNIFNMKRYYSIAILLAGCCLLVSWMATAASQTVFFIIAGVSATTVPTATTLLIVDVLLLPKLFGIKRDLSSVVQWRDLKSTNWLGITAMLVGVVVAIVLSIPGNVIPNVGLSIGIAPVEGWLAAVVLYLAMIAVVRRKSDLRWAMGLAVEPAE